MFERFEEAVKFATEQHSGQLRKMHEIPYILHPLEVASIISTITNDEDLLIAGLLHDTIEDCQTDPMLIKEKFGTRVLALVSAESEDKMSDRPPEETWRERKEDSLLFLEHCENDDVKVLWLADKLANMRSFYREYLVKGEKLWLALNQKDPKQQYWYYSTIAKLLVSLKGSAAYEEYVMLLNKVFEKEIK